MKPAAALMLAALICFTAEASPLFISGGVHAGFIPGLGGSMKSTFQENSLNNYSGVYGINRSTPGVGTKRVDPLLGRYAGIGIDLVFVQHFLLSVGLNGVIDHYGGRGISIDPSGNPMTVYYSVSVYDMPVTAGITLPAGRFARIGLSAGLAPSYGTMTGSFSSSSVSGRGSVTGFAAPMVIMARGDYSLADRFSVYSCFSAYRGATEPLRDSTGYARIDFGCLRWCVGAAFHFSVEIKIRGKDYALAD